MKTKVREEQILSDREQLRRALSSAPQSQGLALRIKNHAINTARDGIMLADLEGKVTCGETTAEKAPAPTLVHRQGTILVVDDEPQVREVISRVLASCGYRVISAQDGQDALVRFGDGSEIDLVVLDMVMPGMGGRECLARLRKANPAVRVVIVTGYTTEGSPQELLGKGAMAIVEKPFDIAAFVKIVQRILET
jgi:CheY-like chemotaxis protein